MGIMQEIEAEVHHSMEDDIPTPRGTVKIYVCSTKADFEWEREKLWCDVLWEVQEVARSYGLSVTLVDMYLGTDHDPVYDRHTFDEFLQEISISHQQSVGPFFLCFLGDKYGPVPLPNLIPTDDFNVIKKQAFDAGKDVRLLLEWYNMRDGGDVYQLKPVPFKHNQFSHTFSGKKINVEDNEVQSWMKDFLLLQDMICSANRNQDSEKKPPREDPVLNLVSGVEEQLYTALGLDISGCLVINRQFIDISEKDSSRAKYVDLFRNTQSIDREARQNLNQLCERLKTEMPEENMISYEIPWAPNGLDPLKYQEHAQYMFNVGIDISSWIGKRVREKMPYSIPSQVMPINIVQSELSTHYFYMKQLTKRPSYGLEEAMDELNGILKNCDLCDSHQMVLLHGPEGSGKSTLLAQWAKSLRSRLGQDLELLIRFVGLSPFSSVPEKLLRNICCQLSLVLGRPMVANSLSEHDLLEYFLSCMPSMAAMSEKTFVFIIDGLDKLKGGSQGSNEATFWESMATMFPPNVHFVVSFTSTPNNTAHFQRIACQIGPQEHVLCLPQLGPEALEAIIQQTLTKWKAGTLSLSGYQRSRDRPSRLALNDHLNMTNSQTYNNDQKDHQGNIIGSEMDGLLVANRGHHDIVKAVARCCEVPLYASLLALESLSVCPVDEQDLGGMSCSLEETIIQRFLTLEVTYSEVVVVTVCRYLTASHYGLTEAELLDLLSCNNQVLQCVYPDDMPTVLRFPIALWLKLRRDLDVLVDERILDGKTVLHWAYSLVASVSASRYFTSSHEIKESHQDIEDLFLGTWVGNKPMVLPSRGVQIIDTGNRYVNQQPLLYSETLYNHRRMNEIWYQLLQAGDVERFKEHAFCNYEFLLAHIHANGVQSLIADFRWTCDHVIDGEVHLILLCLEEALKVLLEDPLQLASQLIGRLRQVKGHYPRHIDTLVQQCMEWCDSYNLPLVVPLSSWLPDPRIPLVATLEEPAGISVICPTRNNQHCFCATLANDINMYHIPSQRLIKTLTGHISTVTCLAMTYNNKYLVSGSVDCTLRVWDIGKGKATHVIWEHTDAILCLVLMSDDDVVVTGSSDHKVRIISMATGEVLHTLSAHGGPVVSVLLNSNDTILVTASSDKKIVLWDMDDMMILNTIEEAIPSPVISMALTCDNTFLLIGCADGSLCVKSFTTGSDIHRLEGHLGKACSVAVSSDCYHAAVGCSDGNLYLYNIRTRELLDAFSGHSHSITSVCCTVNQHFIITAAQDKINVWTFYRRHTHHVSTDEHTKTVTCVNLSRDGKTAITGSKDRLVKLWYLDQSKIEDWSQERHRSCLGSPHDTEEDVCTEYVDEVPPERERQASIVSLDPPNRSILRQDVEYSRRGSKGSNNHVRWLKPVARIQVRRPSSNPSGGAGSRRASGTSISSACSSLFPDDIDEVYMADHPRRRSIEKSDQKEYIMTLPLTGPSKVTETTSVMQDAQYIAGKETTIGASDQIVKLWNMDICDFSADLVGHEGVVTSVALSDDEAFAVSGSADTTVKVWSINMGCIITDYKEHRSTVTSVFVFIDNERVMSVEEDALIKVWLAETGETHLSLTGPTSLLTLSPDCRYAISGDFINKMKMWSVDDGRVIQDIAHNEIITCVTYSMDSQYVVTGSTDMSLKVWQTTTGKLTQILVEHEDTVTCVAVTGNNNYILSGSRDCMLLIWQLETGAVVHRLPGHTDHVSVVKVTKEGSVAISGSKDGSLRVWNVAVGSVITTFDLHCPVLDIHITEKATHLAINLEESLHVPLLCLHNTPAGEVDEQSHSHTHLGAPILPLKPLPVGSPKPPSVFPVPVRSKDRTSISSIPEIIKVSPIRLPLSEAMKTQEKNRISRIQKAATKSNSNQGKEVEDAEKRKSGICVLF